jgi:ZIP family zinc transporter
MAFGAGVLVGAACFDLIPAAISNAVLSDYPKRFVFEYAGLGASVFFSMHREADQYPKDGSRYRTAGRISAGLLILHSAFDGAAIFAATTVSFRIGLIVGLGIVAHDICDGLNSVLLSTQGNKPEWKDYAFLACDALAPVAGGLVAGHLITISPGFVMVFLSIAAGAFLFSAAYDLFPEAYRLRRTLSVPLASMSGFMMVLILTKSIGAFTHP